MSKIKICHVIGNFVNGGVEAVIYNVQIDSFHLDLKYITLHLKVFLLLEGAKRWKQFLEMSNSILFIHI